MANDATIIAGSLDSKELEKSINELINMVDSKLNGDGGMASKFQDGINKMQASLNSLSSTFRGMKGDVKDFASSFDGMAKARQQAINGSKSGGSDRITFDSDVEKGLTYVINANKDVDAQLEAILEKEQQLLDAKNKEAAATASAASAQQNLTNAVSGTAMGYGDVYSQQERANKAIKEHTSSVGTAFRNYDDLRNAIANVLGVEREHVRYIDTENDNYNKLANSLKQLRTVYDNLNQADRSSENGKELVRNMQDIERSMQKIRAQAARPVSLADAMAISEKTLDDMAYKMRMLSAYRGGLDTTKQKNEIDQVTRAYNELKKKMDDLLQRNKDMVASNQLLGRSWNYMKNRLAFYFTVGASIAFVKNLIEVRSQYEMNEKALGVLINSAERGTQIFNQLSQMALVSPYTLMELSSAAKQLVAYDVAAKEVVDTTRRLADMASAVGVPMERLTYALGQIKAYGYLNSRDARMFANAGIPLVKQLAEYYTELEGRLVSTADVYDRIKKKSIDYNDVMQVVNKMTDEGGKFFDFQAKMADTLKVRLANLTLAWNNMLNDLGKQTQGILSFGISALKQLFLQWETINRLIYESVAVLGAYKAAQFIIAKTMGITARQLDAQILAEKRHNAIMLQKQALVRKLTIDELRLISTQNQLTAADYQNILSSKGLTKQKALMLAAFNKNNKALIDALVKMELLTASEAANITVGKALGLMFKSLGISIASAAKAFGAFMVSNWWLIALAGLTELLLSLRSAAKHIEEINKNAAEHAKETYDNIKEYLESNPIQELEVKARAGEVDLDENVKAWETQKEKIEEASIAASTFVSELEKEDDMNKRLAKSFDYLKAVERVAGVMQTLPDDAIKVSTSTWGGLFGEGLKDDLKDFMDTRDEVIRIYGDISDAEKKLKEEQEAAAVGVGNILYDLQEFGKEVRKTIKSVYEIASGEGFNLNEQQEFLARVISETAQAEKLGIKETRIYRMKAEKEYYEYAKAQLEEQIKYQSGEERERSQALIKIYADELNSNKALQQSFFEWLSETQSSKVREMLRNKTKEEIKQGQWLTSQNEAWVTQMAERFSKEYGTSFNVLHSLVLDANTWSVNIPVFFNTMGQLLSDIEKDYESRTGKKFKDNTVIKDAKNQVDVIKRLRDEQERLAEQIETARKAGGEYYEKNKAAWEEQNKQLIADIHAYNALTKAEEDANKKSLKSGTKKDVFGEALEKEVRLITEIQNRFKEYKKMGVDAQEAITLSTNEYGNSIMRNNEILKKYGVRTLASEELATMPIQTVRDFYREQLEGASASTKGVETLEKAIANLNGEITKIDYKKITDGLNNELGKLKDEYELAVELDANPELGNTFMDIFDIDPNNLPSNIDDYANRILDRLNKAFESEKKGFKLETLGLTDDDLRAFREESEKEFGLIGENEYNIIEKSVKEIRDLRKKDREDTLKKTQELQYKLAGINEKIAIEEEKLQRLRSKRNKATNDEERKLLDLQIKEQEQTIAKLGEDVLQLLPTYIKLFNSIADHSANVTRRIAKQWKEALENAIKNADGSYTVIDPTNQKRATISERQYGKELDRVNDKLRESQTSFAKIKEALTSGEDGEKDFFKGLELISQEAQKAAEGIRTVGSIVQELGGEDAEGAVETINDIATSIDGMATAAAGAAQIASGDIIGGTVNVIKGVWGAISTWFDNSDKKITRQIKESERNVAELERAYARLEWEASKALGVEETKNKRAAIATKEAMLAEMERQLVLEQSRKAKKQDEDKINDMMSQIESSRREIEDLKDELISNLLGSDVKSAAEEFVDTWVEAWRAGETTLDAIQVKMDDMIMNLIKKATTSRIVETFLRDLYKQVDEYSKKGSAGDEDFTNEELKALAVLSQELGIKINDALGAFYGNLESLGAISKNINDGEKGLSALQAGIQSISEETAGALEAIMSGMSQQVYLQSTLLTQIKDVIVGVDFDLQAGIQAQILLQLQNSYQTTQAIRSILEGWSSANGMSVRVEMI